MENSVIINGVKYVKEIKTDSNKCIIRTYSAGVHFGQVKRRDGKEVELINARRLWYWAGAASLSQLAVAGVKKPKECKFSVAVPLIILTEAIEIIPCTSEAVTVIESVQTWEV